MKVKTKKILEENTEEHLHDLGWNMQRLLKQNMPTIKENIGKLYIKIKSFFSPNISSQYDTFNKGFISRIKIF